MLRPRNPHALWRGRPGHVAPRGQPAEMQTRTGDLAKNGIGLAGDQAFKFRLRHVEPDADVRLLVVVTVYEVSQ
jgi:hypothetical protein